MARQALIASSVNFRLDNAPAGSVAKVKVGEATFDSVNGTGMAPAAFAPARAAFVKSVTDAVNAAGYPATANPAQINQPLLIGILVYLAILVTMVYAPIAAMLVELFPSKIRYTSMSLPYHIGNGWLGGLLPAIGFAMVAANGNIYYGLWYPVVVAAATVVFGLFFLPETYRNSIDD